MAKNMGSGFAITILKGTFDEYSNSFSEEQELRA
jgi:hypothetical protein